MKARTYNARMASVHEEYASKVLGMPRHLQAGPDLKSDIAVVEVKFRLLHPEHPKKWVVQEHQMKYPKVNGLPAYWALGFYSLDREVKKIPHNTFNPELLEEMVTERTIYLVPWNWMNQYEPHECTGKTEMSEWHLVLRYSTFSKMPEIVQTIQAEKGPIHLTQGVQLEHFPGLQII